MRIVCVHYLSVLGLVLSLPLAVLGTIKSPNNLLMNVGKDAVFMWNTTNSNSILSVEWGLYGSGVVTPSFIYIDKRTNSPFFQKVLNTSAVRYNGRVNWIGDLSAGHAWFKITNLDIQDTNQYSARIREQGTSESTIFSTHLTVAAIPTFPQFSASPHLVEVIEGRDLIINCTAIGPPTPKVQWVESDNTQITGVSISGTVTLIMKNVQRSDDGAKYKCVANNNPNADPVSATIKVTVLYSPQTNITHPSITVVQNKDIVIGCTATGNPKPSLSWSKYGGIIKAAHTTAGGTLTIPDAIKTDAGKYICSANNTFGSRKHVDDAIATVIVVYQPTIINNLRDQTINETGSLTIKCDADGYPTPTIKWRTPSGSVQTGNAFDVVSAKQSDAGRYTCTANNGIGNEATANIQVTVQYKPAIEVSKSTRFSESWNGNSTQLKCFANGLPAPQILWFKATHQKITTGIKVVPGGSEVTVLTTADPGDYGQYECRATNIMGSDKHFINVTRLFPPGPVIIDVYEIEASSITLRWTKPAYDGGSPVIDYKVEISKKPSVVTVNTHAVITGLEANMQHTVKVYARNIVGNGQQSISVNFINTTKQGNVKHGTSGENNSKCLIGVGVVAAILVASLVINALQFLYIWKNISPNETRNHSKKRKTTKKCENAEVYDNELELNEKATSPITVSLSQKPTQMDPEYEAIQQQKGSHEASPYTDPSDYQELNLTPNTPVQGNQEPVYEQLGTRSTALHNYNENQSYEPLNIKHQPSNYQSLQSNKSRESVI